MSGGDRLQAAMELHRAGDLSRAEALYRQVLTQSPDQPDALHLLGLIAHQQGRPDVALELIGRAIRLKGAEPGYHGNLGLVYQALGRFDEAAASHRRALALAPAFAEAHCNLGYVLVRQGHAAEAVEACRRALALRPDLAPARYNLALAFDALGESALAEAQCRKALAGSPGNAELHFLLGLSCQKQGRFDEAFACFERALALRPDHAGAHCLLGVEWMRRSRLDDAILALEQALALEPAHAEACYFLGYARLQQGRHEEAREALLKALTLRPDYPAAFDTLLFSLLYARGIDDRTLAAHREYAGRFETPLRPGWPRHRNLRDPERRLRIAYLSPDFRRHSVAIFLEPVLEHHDRAAFEVCCYHDSPEHDEVTDRLIASAARWIPCHGLSDAALADRIRMDGIDILVDLAGHSANNRLGVFARKPAPVQVTWLGYPETTGLTAIDWRISCDDVDPPGDDRWRSEALWRLPHSLWCYRPPADIAIWAWGQSKISRDAAQQNHLAFEKSYSDPELPELPDPAPPISFGSMNVFAKVTPVMLGLWAEILDQLPGARLVMTNVPPGSAQRRAAECFAARGIAADRVTIHGTLPFPEFRAVQRAVDIALDPFPYNGTTTTCESLWLGIPVVSMAGDSSVSRSGLALLKMAGQEDLCAHDAASYVRIAVALARDRQRLASLRAGLRARVEASPLCDEDGFTRGLEAAYRGMWRKWCGESDEQARS